MSEIPDHAKNRLEEWNAKKQKKDGPVATVQQNSHEAYKSQKYV